MSETTTKPTVEETAVVTDLVRGQMLGFSGTMITGITRTLLPEGTFTGKIVSLASFRQFKASENSEHAGELFGVLECQVELAPIKDIKVQTIPVRINPTFVGYVNQVVSVKVTNSTSKNGREYSNAVMN